MVVAHATMYFELALFAPPVGVVLVSVLRSLRGRRPLHSSPHSEESTR